MQIPDRLNTRIPTASILIAVYLVSVFILFHLAGPPFFYPMDDTYIHTATARTLATTGVWGVSPASPAAASSSPLWTVLLAGAWLTSPRAWFVGLPLALNLLAGCALILLLVGMFREKAAALALAAVIFCAAALPSVSMLGMEHLLHAFCALLLGLAGCRALADPDENSDFKTLAWIALLSAAADAVRYESLFLVAPLAALAALRRRWPLVLAFGLGAATPVLGFGLLWIHNGGWLLPNSLLLKTDVTKAGGMASSLAAIAARSMKNLHSVNFIGEFSAMIIGVVAFLYFYWKKFRQVWDVPLLFGLCAVAATAAHLAFASVGWLVRYEAWLIVLDLSALFLLAERLLAPRALFLLAALVAALFAARVVDATARTVLSIDDRRVQHLAPALFVKANYPGETIMVNDIGAVAWFAPQSQALDVFGLGDNEPLRLSFSPGGYDSAALRDWALRANARIAILEVCWKAISRLVPDEWRLVASWRIPRNVVFGEHVIGFFATSPDEDVKLDRAMAQFPLPEGVALKMRPSRAAMKDGCYDDPAR